MLSASVCYELQRRQSLLAEGVQRKCGWRPSSPRSRCTYLPTLQPASLPAYLYIPPCLCLSTYLPTYTCPTIITWAVDKHTLHQTVHPPAHIHSDMPVKLRLCECISRSMCINFYSLHLPVFSICQYSSLYRWLRACSTPGSLRAGSSCHVRPEISSGIRPRCIEVG